MFHILQTGGWVMILLAILALLLYITAFDLLYYVYSGNVNEKSEKHWRHWVESPAKAQGRVGEVLRYTQGGNLTTNSIQQRFEEVRFGMSTLVDHRLGLLRTLVATAPLAGLLGTVIGMLNTFGGLAAGGGESMSRVAGGIHEALLTTQTGLLIALPGVFAILVIRRRKQATEAALAKLESLTIIMKTGIDQEMDDEEDDVSTAPAPKAKAPVKVPVPVPVAAEDFGSATPAY